MAKAMLIMDMPNCCKECPCVDELGYIRVCHCMGEVIESGYAVRRQDNCPLREVPSKHEDGHTLKVAIENDCYDDTVQDDAYFEGIDKGYNRCIDEILGGGE